ncbi:unnamed protein product, partial [Trichobilharzia regenti]
MDHILCIPVHHLLRYVMFARNYGLEYELSDTEGVKLCALISAIERRLAPAVNWFLWADDCLYSLAKVCITSLSYVLNENTYFVGNSYNHLFICIIFSVYFTAHVCVRTCRPTAVDAYVFAFIWPLLLYESEHGDSNWWDIDYTKVPSSVSSLSSSSAHVQSSTHQLITHLLQCSN